MRRIVALLAIVLCAASAFAQISSPQAKRQDILRLLEMIGAGKNAAQGFDYMLPSLKEAMPNVPEQVWKELRGEIRDHDMLELTASIWDKHFTHQEIRELIHFYTTPIGQKVIRETPAIQEESMIAGQKWGNEIVGRILQRLKEKGYRVPESLDTAK